MAEHEDEVCVCVWKIRGVEGEEERGPKGKK